MKKVLLGSLALTAMVAAAPASASGDWTGWYAGLNAGAALNDSKYDLTPDGCFSTTCGGTYGGGTGSSTANQYRTAHGKKLDKAAFLGGAQLGYNWQHQNWVYGVEVDYDYLGLDQSKNDAYALSGTLAGTFNHDVKQKMEWLGTARGRVGMLANPCTLIYLTGGYAIANVKSKTTMNFTTASDDYAGSSSKTKSGWTAGLGSEYAWNNNWLAKIEYLYADFDKLSYENPNSNATNTLGSYNTTIRTKENIVRVGVDYRF